MLTPFRPLLVAFVSDLMFVPRIESAAQNLGFDLRLIETTDQLAPPETSSLSPEHAPTAERQPAEHLSGSGAILLDRISAWQPALIIFDLGHAAIPWRDWLPLLKSTPATRRLPVVCFGSHVDTQTFQLARSCGADAVLARSRFFEDLPGLIQKYARLVDYAALQETCQLPLSELALQGLELFNQGEYFEAHEVLEHAWNVDQTPGRELYRAILQVAVAYLQIERGNYNGAVKMFLRLRQWLNPLPETCRGVDIAQLRQDAATVERRLLELGSERIAEFERDLFRPVIFQI